MEGIAAAQGLTLAQPFPHRTSDTVWARCHQTRDRIYAQVSLATAEAGFDVLIEKSFDFEFPAWVKLSAWLPVEAGATQRVSLTFTSVPMPHHRFEHEFAIAYEREQRKRAYGPFHQLSEEAVGEWTRFILGKARARPSVRRDRLRVAALQFWRPRNKVAGLGFDFARWGVFVGLGATLLAVSASDLQLAFELYEEYLYYGELEEGWSDYLNPTPLVLAAAFLVTTLGGLVHLWRRRRRRVDINAGKPVGEPRYRRLADSWHTLVLGLGAEAEEVRQRLHAALTAGGMEGLRSWVERISYVGADGKQERDQLVLSFGRSMIFCHLYTYGDDLFVGWQAYVNFGEWVEKRVADGYDRSLGRPIRINTVVPGLHSVTEYDLIDLNSLIEWTHARMTAVVKRLVEERRIDQEIDFQILRSERRNLLDQDEKQQQAQLRKPSRSGGFVRRA